MTEAGFCTAFGGHLRKADPKGTLIKHRDAGMVGLPDFSYTSGGKTLWLEAKLVNYEDWMAPISWPEVAQRLVERFRRSADKQYETLTRLDGLYLVCVKKTCVLFIEPSIGDPALDPKDCRRLDGPRQAALSTVLYVHEWEGRPRRRLGLLP